MRKIIYHGAASADGYIARPDGGVEWLERPRPKGDYGLAAFYKSIDAVLMGRNTYDVARRFGLESYPGKRNYVFTHKRRRAAAPNVEFVREPVEDFARRLRSSKGKNVWLVGGAQLAAAFLDAGHLDELIVHVIPVLIGEGVPLIQPRHRSLPLELLNTRAYPDGVVRLHYSVMSPAAGGENLA